MIQCDVFVAMVRMFLFCSNVTIKRITSAADVQIVYTFCPDSTAPKSMYACELMAA